MRLGTQGLALAAVAAANLSAVSLRPEGPELEMTVVVAARDLNPGVPITASDVYGLRMPAAWLTEGIFLTPGLVVGRVPHDRILANEPVRGERLADAASGVGLDVLVPRGLVAVSVLPTHCDELAKWMAPGSFVDVEVNIPGTPYRTTVRVVAFQTDPFAVTLAATPEVAGRIAQAQASREVSLTLRNDLVDSKEVMTLEGVDLGDPRCGFQSRRKR